MVYDFITTYCSVGAGAAAKVGKPETGFLFTDYPPLWTQNVWHMPKTRSMKGWRLRSCEMGQFYTESLIWWPILPWQFLKALISRSTQSKWKLKYFVLFLTSSDDLSPCRGYVTPINVTYFNMTKVAMRMMGSHNINQIGDSPCKIGATARSLYLFAE